MSQNWQPEYQQPQYQQPQQPQYQQPQYQQQGTPGLERFKVRQKLTLMVNRYEIRHVDPNGNEGELICFAEQKRMTFKEQVTFFSDTQKTTPVFAFKARKVIDLGSGYDVTDPAGNTIGHFKKMFGKSLLRSTWELKTPDGLEAVGQERNAAIAILRRIWGFIPFVNNIPVPFLFHFDFRASTGSIVMSSTKKIGLRDAYTVETPALNGWRMDWRVAAAMCVALDALQSR